MVRAVQIGAFDDEQALVVKHLPDPTSWKEAMESADSKQWFDAASAEFKALTDNNTWLLVELPRGRKAISTRWVFRKKKNADGSIDRYKARLCAKGFLQKEGIDYKQVFAPVVKYNSIRIILALAAELDLDLHQMDVTTAFLNGELEEVIYMQQPRGFEARGKENLVCELIKAIYGLKQASRTWYQNLDCFLRSLGFTMCKADACVYVRRSMRTLLIIAVYVDDLIIASSNPEERLEIQCQLHKRYKMKDLGALEWCLGMEIKRNRSSGTVTLNQSQYIKEVLGRFNMSVCKASRTPDQVGTHLSKTMSPSVVDEAKTMEVVPYRNAVGSLMFAARGSRPDIATSTRAVSRFMDNPGRRHWQAVKKILWYLQGTASLGITFRASGNRKVTLSGYADSNWAGDIDNRRSTTGYVFLIAGGPVSWTSKTQPTVALSTTEAEYMAAAAAAQEAIWIRTILNELGFKQHRPTIIFEDNQGCIKLTENGVSHGRTKHIDIRHHYVREQVARNSIKFKYLQTDKMVADMLTKPLSPPAFIKLRAKLLGHASSNSANSDTDDNDSC